MHLRPEAAVGYPSGMAETWLKCSACRSDIAFGSKYFQCSVSTCNRARTRLVFCSVPCWDSHVATLRHRDAWAEDKIAPSKAAWERELADQPAEPPRPPPAAPRPAAPAPVARPAPTSAPAPATPAATAPAPQRRIVGEPPPAPAPAGVALQDVADRDILIVMSKLKKYIKDRSGMNCSDGVAEVLSDHVRALADESIRAAGRDERKTVLDRDVPRPPRR
jgi:histone H3/H4